MGITHVEKGQEEETHEAESMHCDGTHFQIKEKKDPRQKEVERNLILLETDMYWACLYRQKKNYKEKR